MTPLRNIFACLVHESPDCVVDLVRNLHFLDPTSVILLYNGGRTPNLLNCGFPFATYGAIMHPSPRPMEWGHLHDFALDCMQFALSELPFDTLTIIDSDQLATRRGYSEYLATLIGGHIRLGMLGSSPGVQDRTNASAPAHTAFKEFELWRPYLRRFPLGEQKFVYWTFWPSTVFTNDAAWNLTRMFATDRELSSIMSRSSIWATEELIFPTLLALLGFDIAPNPCSFDYVQYKAVYTQAQIDAALRREDVFWVHPVPRRYDDPIRKQIRESVGYHLAPILPNTGGAMSTLKQRESTGMVLSLPILNRMKTIDGWLNEKEADLLLATCHRAVASSAESAIVEIGSFCGRSTVVLGSVLQSLAASTKVYAIDSHEGIVGAAGSGGGIKSLGSTLDVFHRNITENALTPFVEAIVKRSYEVTWDKPIALLFVDGLHDYDNVSRDFHHFEPWVVAGGYIAFHDYADYYPGVKKFVDELVALPHFEPVLHLDSMFVIRKTKAALQEQTSPAVSRTALEKDTSDLVDTPTTVTALNNLAPMASCIMPTANRRLFVPRAISHFLRQDYSNRELIILDDGDDSITDIIPQDARIRYLRLDRKFSMGVKHNMACEIAHGEIIVHWDDDDWVSPHRISYQVRELQEETKMSSMETLCGLSRVMFYDPRVQRAWEYQYPGGRPWVLGATFCYYKDFARRHPFPDINEGADTAFVWNLQNAHVRAHPDHTFYVGTVHAHNTSAKRTESIGWRSLSNEDVRSLMDKQDWSFYESFPSWS